MNGFGSLYYTDCVPGQGLQGGAGFQFQAATPGDASEAMHVVQRSALYEPPTAWMRDRRPVADYPRSLAHTAEEGFFATAAGRYLGQEANGTRQGNQFTHAIVTKDPAAYGSVRPAQLWGADWWAHEPAPDTTLAELAPIFSVPGPLDIETVRDRVGAATDADRLLEALVSALQHLADPDRRRTVVLVGEDPERSACWLAAATLLLPSPQALRISFKIFVTDPQYARHEVIALHPDWAGRWSDTRSDSGLVVFDLDQERCSTVEATASAAFWVPRFLSEDPFDVVEAVERAGEFAAARANATGAAEEEPTTADRQVALVVVAGASLSAPAAEDVATWLRTAPKDALEIARDDALEAVLATEPPAEVLRTLAAAVSGGTWEAAAVHRVLDGLLISELNEAGEAADRRAALARARGYEPLQPPGRAGHDRTVAHEAVEYALRAAAAERIPALLAVARRHEVEPRPDQLGDAHLHFARWWLRQPPDAELMPEEWDAPDYALDWVRVVLREELVGPSAEAAIRIVQELWWKPLFEGARNPADRLDQLIWSATYLYRRGEAATRLRRTVLDACRRTYDDSAHAGTVAWWIVARFTDPELAECLAFVNELQDRGMPLSKEVADRFQKTVVDQRKLSADGLDVLHVVREHGHQLIADLAHQRGRDLDVRRITDDLRTTKPVRSPKDIAAALNDVSVPMLAVRLPAIVDAFNSAPPRRAADVLCAAGPKRRKEIVDELMRRWPQPGRECEKGQARAVALMFVLTGQPQGKQQTADFDVLRNLLGQCVTALGKDERAAVFRAVPHELRDAWARWLREIEPSRIKRGLSRMTGGRLGDPGKTEG